MTNNVGSSCAKNQVEDLTKTSTVDNNVLSLSFVDPDVFVTTFTQRSGILGTTMNLANIILGSGLLALPYLTLRIGWAIALVLLCFVSVLSLYGIHLLNKIAEKIGGRQTSIGVACCKTYPWLTLVVDALTVLSVWAVAVVYMMIAAENIPDVVRQFTADNSDDEIYYQYWFWLIICWASLAFPLSMLRSVWLLSYTSLAAVVCVMWTTFVIFAYSIGIFDPCEGKEIDCEGDVLATVWNLSSIMKVFPVFVVSYSIGPVLFSIFNAMDKQTAKRMDISGAFTVSLVTVLYAIICVCGYTAFGSNVTPDILDSFPISVVASIARVGTAVVVTFSYPLLMHTARDSCIHACETLFILVGKIDQGSSILDHTSKSGNILFYATAIVLNLSAFVLAYCHVNFNTILSITGAIGNINLSFTIPALLYWKMFENEGMSWQRASCIPLVFFGVFSMVISLWANFNS
eukprot:CFRG2868T1